MLDIENAEELLVAQRAVEEFRKTKIRHVGLHAKRMDYPCEQSTRERAFADGWRRENTLPWDDGGGVLRVLLEREVTPELETAAATVIQWLGTNVGWCFLCGCISAAGYNEPLKKVTRLMA